MLLESRPQGETPNTDHWLDSLAGIEGAKEEIDSRYSNSF
jgi:hypothetical protein